MTTPTQPAASETCAHVDRAAGSGPCGWPADDPVHQPRVSGRAIGRHPFQPAPLPDDAKREESKQDMLRATFISRVIQRVAELPDRTSPDDWPDAMLVTPKELDWILRDEMTGGGNHDR